MKTPTLEEVKAFFKDAKEVKGTFRTFDISEVIHTLIFSGNTYKVILKDSWIAYVWSKEKGYAKIISYKSKLYQLTAKEIKHAYENPQYLKDTFKEVFEEPKQLTIAEIEKILGYKILIK